MIMPHNTHQVNNFQVDLDISWISTAKNSLCGRAASLGCIFSLWWINLVVIRGRFFHRQLSHKSDDRWEYKILLLMFKIVCCTFCKKNIVCVLLSPIQYGEYFCFRKNAKF